MVHSVCLLATFVTSQANKCSLVSDSKGSPGYVGIQDNSGAIDAENLQCELCHNQLLTLCTYTV